MIKTDLPAKSNQRLCRTAVLSASHAPKPAPAAKSTPFFHRCMALPFIERDQRECKQCARATCAPNGLPFARSLAESGVTTSMSQTAVDEGLTIDEGTAARLIRGGIAGLAATA